MKQDGTRSSGRSRMSGREDDQTENQNELVLCLVNTIIFPMP